MRILIATSALPFSGGGNRVIAQELLRTARQAGHQAEILITPQNPYGRQCAAYLATLLTDVSQGDDGSAIDRVISLRYPAFSLRHPRHVCWLNHRMREFDDLWPAHRAALSHWGRAKGVVRRAMLSGFDRRAFRRLYRFFVQSETLRRRVLAWDGSFDPQVLHPPAPLRPYRCEGYGDFILVLSRLEPHKRVDLALRTLALLPKAVRMKIAGDGSAANGLHALARELGLQGRVDFLGPVSEEEKLGLYARCGLVLFTPLNEDFGFITPEAFASAKAVVTCHDSGGPVELVRDGQNGLVAAADPQSLAARIAPLWEDRARLEQLGQSALAQGRRLTWEQALERLLQ
jgi:glycosyltransferase involved in cell wall biosynthesis